MTNSSTSSTQDYIRGIGQRTHITSMKMGNQPIPVPTWPLIGSTALMAAALIIGVATEKHPTEGTVASYIEHAPIIAKETYSFTDRGEVMAYLQKHQNVSDLIKTVPALVYEVVGKSALSLAMRKDDIEGWEFLEIKITSGHAVDDLIHLEDNLLDRLMTNDKHGAALELVNIVLA